MAKFISIDPLEFFPYEICEKIFKYLPVRDLLQSSLVSSSWYKFIANNQKLTTNIKVKTSCKQDQYYAMEIIQAITMSERKYENLEVERCDSCMFPINYLLLSKKWKSVTVYRSSFSYPQEAVEFFRCIEQNVEELIMNGVYVRCAYSDGINKGLKFPKLKKFVALNMQAFLFQEVFPNLQQFEHFEIFSNDQNIGSLNTVINFLKVNKNLKSLQISGSVFNQIMYEDLSEKIPFKLNKLVISNGSYHHGSPFYDRIYENLVALIKCQAEFLEIISIDDWMGESVLKAIFNLPKLKELTIKGFSHIYEFLSLQELKLAANSSIKSLHLSMIPDDHRILESIIRCTPALRELSISLLNQSFMEVINRVSKNLKHLSVDYLNITHVESKNMLNSLYSLCITDFRLCLRESILGQSYENLSVFEKMLHQRMNYY